MAARKVKKAPARKRADPLAEYSAKRDFSRTSEPGPVVGTGEGRQFVVQKHDARRVHYDLRLELGGTLKSWAVTRGPSLIVGEKRLAVRTEDHPMQYLDFEGNIPQGEYGGGAMIVWDRGQWSAASDPEAALRKGHLDIALDGERLHGRWHLVRMKPRPGEKKEQWLMIKSEDAHSRPPGTPDITEEFTTSLSSGLTTRELAAQGEQPKARAKAAAPRTPPNAGKVPGARKAALPDFIEPMLPQVADKAPSGAGWVHEIKYDGYRTQARIDGGDVKLLTRKGLDWTARFPSVAGPLKTLGLSAALIDGEIMVEDSAGIPSFALLQADLEAKRMDRFRYVMYDLLHCDGFDLTRATLLDRKALLQDILSGLPATSPLRFGEHLDQDGPTMFEHACRLGLEGIVSKRADQPYRSGRGPHWLKIKGVLRQEFVILGHVQSTAAAGFVGALAVGYYDNGKLTYAGRVGSGFSSAVARSLRKRLDAIAATKPKLAAPLPAGVEKGLRWVTPTLVCEVEYRGWTNDRLIRQSAFKGLREDRAPEEVMLETKPPPAKPDRAAEAKRSAWRGRLTHPERVLWPEPGITKEGLAEFYASIADWVLPHLKGRVLSLVRCPSGLAAKCFYAKHAWNGLSDALRRVDVGEDEKMLTLDGIEGLIDLVQASVLEIHPWGSMHAQLEQPDRLIFDLDPGPDVTWSAVVDAAFDVRARLDALGLQSFVKTSGGKGLHVVLPITPRADWDEAKAFTQSIAEEMARDQPERYVAIMSKALRKGRIFVDYLRNGRGATAVAAFSTRALPQASVSTPLAWDELTDGIRADHFRIDNLRQRLDVLKQDPWDGFFTLRQALPAQKGKRRAVPAKR